MMGEGTEDAAQRRAFETWRSRRGLDQAERSLEAIKPSGIRKENNTFNCPAGGGKETKKRIQ